MNQPSTLYYILGFLAFLYLVLPHVVSLFTTEHMTNADMFEKMKTFKVWEMFDEVKVTPDKELSETLPGETPDVPAGPIPASNKKEVEKPIDAATYNAPQKELESNKGAADPNQEADAPVDRALDKEVQIPSTSKKVDTAQRKIIKKNVAIAQMPVLKNQDTIKTSSTGIRGPTAPPLDKNQPSPGDNDSKIKQGSGVYPDIYGPDLLQVPGGDDQMTILQQNDFVPAAEFPAGPLFPSPYLNDFSKMLKT